MSESPGLLGPLVTWEGCWSTTATVAPGEGSGRSNCTGTPSWKVTESQGQFHSSIQEPDEWDRELLEEAREVRTPLTPKTRRAAHATQRLVSNNERLFLKASVVSGGSGGRVTMANGN